MTSAGWSNRKRTTCDRFRRMLPLAALRLRQPLVPWRVAWEPITRLQLTIKCRESRSSRSQAHH